MKISKNNNTCKMADHVHTITSPRTTVGFWPARRERRYPAEGKSRLTQTAAKATRGYETVRGSPLSLPSLVKVETYSSAARKMMGNRNANAHTKLNELFPRNCRGRAHIR